jgi:hypothetical protein
MVGNELALGCGMGDGTRERIGAARFIEPEAASTAHVSKIDEYEPALGHVRPRANESQA